MQRVVILGGGVGGTLTANLVARKLKARIAQGRGEGHRRRRAPASTRYQPGYMYIAMGHERPERLDPPRAVAPRQATSTSSWTSSQKIDVEASRVELASGEALHYDQLVIATGLAHRPRDDRGLRPGGPPLLHGRGLGEAAQGARRLHRRQDPDRHRRDPLQVPAGAARGRLPHRFRAARARPAREDRDPVPVADQPGLHDRERQRDGDPDLRGEGDRPPAPGRDRFDRRRAQGRHHRRHGGVPVRPPDLRPAPQGRPGRDRLRARPEVGLAADRPLHPAGQEDGRARARRTRTSSATPTSTPSATPPTCRSRRPARRPISRRRSSRSGSPPPSWAASPPASTPSTPAR